MSFAINFTFSSQLLFSFLFKIFADLMQAPHPSTTRLSMRLWNWGVWDLCGAAALCSCCDWSTARTAQGCTARMKPPCLITGASAWTRPLQLSHILTPAVFFRRRPLRRLRSVANSGRCIFFSAATLTEHWLTDGRRTKKAHARRRIFSCLCRLAMK